MTLNKNTGQCEISAQIFTGGFLSKVLDFEAVEKKLKPLLSRLRVNKLIMGWSFSKELYHKTADLLAKHDTEFYLWFPVFSETGSVRPLSGLVDINGSPIQYDKNNNIEDFSFCCPNDPGNMEKILDIYESEFASIPFDGIFLDKIRCPSFGQGSKNGDGYRSVFSCFCTHCLEKYEENNFSPDKLKDVLSRYASTPPGIKSYSGNGKYEFEDPVMAQFFLLKSVFIWQSVNYLCNFFRSGNLGIGLDVFAPFLAPFTGQDLSSLSGICDFIKPMMYRITNAPAGLPFETEMFLRETGFADNEKDMSFDRILGINSRTIPFDLGFASRELKNFAAVSKCPVYAGLEINRKDNIADTSPAYIEETIRSYLGTGIKGLALSWDLMDVPEENLNKVIRAYSKTRLVLE